MISCGNITTVWIAKKQLSLSVMVCSESEFRILTSSSTRISTWSTKDNKQSISLQDLSNNDFQLLFFLAEINMVLLIDD